MKKHTLNLILFVFIALLNHQCEDNLRYKNANIPIEDRVNDLLSRMTLEEKAAQLDMLSANDLLDGPDKLNENQTQYFIDSMSIGSIHDFYPSSAIIANEVQRRAIENSRLGIPILFIEEALHGYQGKGATNFPVPIGNSCSWDTTLLYNIGRTIATEARAHGVHFVLGPNLDLAREIRWGRVEETFGEDTYLSSRYAVNLIKGLQGNKLSDNNAVVAEPKHFGIHGIPEGGSNVAPVSIGEREARSTHLYVFEKAVKEAKAKGIMAAYHERDGIPCVSDSWLLKTILREEWGFDGFVLSDLGAIAKQYGHHHTVATEEEAILSAIKAGLDMQFYDYPHQQFQHTIIEAVKSKKLSMSDLDRAVKGILRVKFELGLFDEPYTDINLASRVLHCKEHQKLALEAAHKSIVLLQNENQVLPLSKEVKSITLVGNLVDATHSGGYSPAGTKAVSVYDALKKRLGNEVKINYVNNDISDRFSNVPLSALTPLSNSTGMGLDVTYFNNASLEGEPAYTGISGDLSIGWHNLSPAPGINPDNFSTRWVGYLTVPFTGEYEFELNADDYARVFFNHALFINAWCDGKRRQSNTKKIRLTGGQKIPICIEQAELYDVAFLNFKWRMTDLPSSSLYNKIISAAGNSDVTIVVIGETGEEVGENHDRQNLYPHSMDIEIIKAAQKSNKPVITVMLTGRPLILTDIAAHSTAVVQAWFAGESAGTAITDVLWGDYNPSGRLTISFPKTQGQLPVYYSKMPSSDRTYVDGNGIPLFAFGHGLSYSSFDYEHLLVEPENPKITDNITVSLDVTNTSAKDGAEVVQLYVNDKVSSVVTPVKELKGFSHVFIKAGEMKRVTMVLTPEHLSLINRDMKRVVEPGQFEILVGSSSSDIRLNQTIEVTDTPKSPKGDF
jgi:beta-glucosidase